MPSDKEKVGNESLNVSSHEPSILKYRFHLW